MTVRNNDPLRTRVQHNTVGGGVRLLRQPLFSSANRCKSGPVVDIYTRVPKAIPFFLLMEIFAKRTGFRRRRRDLGRDAHSIIRPRLITGVAPRLTDSQPHRTGYICTDIYNLSLLFPSLSPNSCNCCPLPLVTLGSSLSSLTWAQSKGGHPSLPPPIFPTMDPLYDLSSIVNSLSPSLPKEKRRELAGVRVGKIGDHPRGVEAARLETKRSIESLSSEKSSGVVFEGRVERQAWCIGSPRLICSH